MSHYIRLTYTALSNLEHIKKKAASITETACVVGFKLSLWLLLDGKQSAYEGLGLILEEEPRLAKGGYEIIKPECLLKNISGTLPKQFINWSYLN
jgi:hypothetical protein